MIDPQSHAQLTAHSALAVGHSQQSLQAEPTENHTFLHVALLGIQLNYPHRALFSNQFHQKLVVRAPSSNQCSLTQPVQLLCESAGNVLVGSAQLVSQALLTQTNFELFKAFSGERLPFKLTHVAFHPLKQPLVHYSTSPQLPFPVALSCQLIPYHVAETHVPPSPPSLLSHSYVADPSHIYHHLVIVKFLRKGSQRCAFEAEYTVPESEIADSGDASKGGDDGWPSDLISERRSVDDSVSVHGYEMNLSLLVHQKLIDALSVPLGVLQLELKELKSREGVG